MIDWVYRKLLDKKISALPTKTELKNYQDKKTLQPFDLSYFQLVYKYFETVANSKIADGNCFKQVDLKYCL